LSKSWLWPVKARTLGSFQIDPVTRQLRTGGRRPGFGLRVPLKLQPHGGRCLVGCSCPGLKLKIWGTTIAFFSTGFAGCKNSSRIPPPITKLIAPSSDKFNSRSIQRSPSSEPPRLRTFPSIEMLLPTRMKGSTPQRVDVAFLEGPQVASGLGTGLGAKSHASR
jgi:hypothetical protein